MKIERLVCGIFEENCFIISKENNKTALIIDPGFDAKYIIDALEKNGLHPAAILLTHGHFDHLNALNDLLLKFPNLPVYIDEADANWAFTAPLNTYHPYYTLQQRPQNLNFIEDGKTVDFMNDLKVHVIATPGHTPGGVCYFTENENSIELFVGDTLFESSVGRTDLPGGDWNTLANSLEKIKTEFTGKNVNIYSGHGSNTTLEKELKSNPYLRSEQEIW